MQENFDDSLINPESGISVDEQHEILVQINGIAEKNRARLLERGVEIGKKAVIKAKKSGAFFPLAVNIIAVLVLIAGSILIIHLNSIRSVQIRTGSVDYDLTLTGGVQLETSDELASAMSELERLTKEQREINAVDALISGGLITVSSLIQEVQFDRASREVQELRAYLSLNSLASSHAFQSRRTFYNQLLDFADTLISDARRQFDLILLTQRLEGTINDLNTTIGSLEADIITLDQTIITRDGTILSLETVRNNLNQTIEERNRSISELEALRTALNQTIGERDGTITALTTERNSLNQTIVSRDNTITALETQRNTLNQTIETRDGTISSLTTERNNLNQTVIERDSTISSLRTEIAQLNARITELTTQLANIRNVLGDQQ